MAVPSYEIYISDLANPSFYFANNDIKEPSSIQNVDVIGDKLSIDTFAVNVFYRGENVDGLRTLPFGTPVWYFKNGVLIYKFYIDHTTRVRKIEFKLECVSSIGLLDKSSHIGGVYTGQTVEELLGEIIGNIVEYSVDEDVAAIKVFGYLPYKSRRDNLHQLMFAYNISILRDADGDMRFTFLRSEENPDEIDSNRIYVDGQVEYPAVATEVLVVEHSYQFDDSEDEVTLFDNTSSAPASHKRVIFDTAPIYVPSLKTTESMVIEVAHPNFVVVSGTGTVKGIPYYDNISSINRTNETSGEEYNVAIKDATLVNVLNSEFVADRVMAYYSSAKIVKGDIKIANEAVGHRYTFLDAFGEQVTGYLHKITTYASSFVRATSEFITGYESQWFGNNYTNYIEATEPCDIIVPQGCAKLRFVIISGGEGGTKGERSTAPPGETVDHGTSTWDPSPGKGGDPGEEGLGGNIREIVINNPEPGVYHCEIGLRGSGVAQYDDNTLCNTLCYHQAPTASSVTTPDDTVYSSDDPQAYKCKSGVMNPFTSVVYGKDGLEGIPGGTGGRGNYPQGEKGEDVYYDGVWYTGGTGAKGFGFDFTHVNLDAIDVGGGGGDAAMAYINGASAIAPSIISYSDQTASKNATCYEEVYFTYSVAKTAIGIIPEKETGRGNGGDAGCGGGGIGGEGQGVHYREEYNDASNKLVHRVAISSAYPSEIGQGDDGYITRNREGTYGRHGGRGIIIAYADAPLTIENEESLPTPELTAVSGASSSRLEITFSNLAPETRYYVERKLVSIELPDSENHYIPSGDTSTWKYFYKTPDGELNWRLLYYMGAWEPRGYVDTESEQTSLLFYEENNPVKDPETGIVSGVNVWPKCSYLYRIKSYGSEEIGESDYSNELVVGFGLDQYESNPIIDIFPLYIDSKLEIGVYTGVNKPVYVSSAYENIQRRRANELQWYDLMKGISTNWLFRNSLDIPTGEEFEYRVFVSGPDKLSSQFSDSKSIVVPEVTNTLFAPYFEDAVWDTQGTNLNHVRLIAKWMFCDERATTMQLWYKFPGRAWWTDWSSWSLSSLGPVGRYQTWNGIIRRTTTEITTVDVKLYNYTSGYGYGESKKIEFEYPDNLLLDHKYCCAYYSDGAIVLEWDAIEHAASTYIYRQEHDGSAWSPLTLLSDSISGNTYTDNTITEGTLYYYAVGSVPETGYLHSAGNGFRITAEEGAWSGMLQPPVLTSYYTYEQTEEGYIGYITLEWTEVQHATGYLVERKKDDELWKTSNSQLFPPSTLTWKDNTTEFGSTYSYRVITWGNNSNVVALFDCPSNVETKMAVNGQPIELAVPVFTLAVEDRFAGSVRISWSAVSDALSYLIQRKSSLDASDDWIDIPVSYATLSYIDTGTTIGQSYDYRMKAVGNEISVISSEFSDISVIEIEDPWASLIYLDSPTMTLAQVTDSLDRPVNAASITWTSVEHVSGYKLERKLSTDSAWGTIYSGSLTTYSDQNLTWDVTYDYRITAVGDLITYRDSLTNSDSIEIELPIAQQLATPVLSGSETTSGGDKAVALSWQAITGGSSYKLERKLSEDAAYAVIESAISSSAVSYTDTSVRGGSTYIYRLTANGDSLYYTDSDPSATVEVDLGWAIETVIYNNGSPSSGYSFYGASGELVVLTTGNWNSGSLQIMNVTEGGTQIAQALGDTVSNQSYGYYTAYRFTNPIDLTNYKQVVFTLKMPSTSEKKFNIPSGSTGYGWGYLYCRTNATGSIADKTTYFENLSTNFEEYVLDVSNISGERLIGIQLLAHTPSLSTEVWIKKIALYG